MKKTCRKRVLLTDADVKCEVKLRRNRLTHRFHRVEPVHKVSFPHVDPDLEQQDASDIRVILDQRCDSIPNELTGCVFKQGKSTNNCKEAEGQCKADSSGSGPTQVSQN